MKELIASFRKLFALDEKTLPDSMTPEEFGKFIESQAGSLFVKPEDFKNLQRIVSEKDRLIKEIEDREKKSPKKEEKKNDSDLVYLREEIQKLNQQLADIAREKKVSELKELFPDIHPSLLVDKSAEEIEKVVSEQRKISQSIYSDSVVFRQPNYSSIDEIETAKKAVIGDKNLSGVAKASEIMRLNRLKNNLTSNE